MKFSLIAIIAQPTIGGTPRTRRVFFLPNLSAVNMVITGASVWPRPIIAARVDASEGVNLMGAESGLVSFPRVGEFHPTMQPAQNIRLAPASEERKGKVNKGNKGNYVR